MHKKPFLIYQGGKASFVVNITRGPNKRPMDLTLIEDITTCFENEDGTELMIELGSGITVQGNPLLGSVLIELSSTETAALIPVQLATLELAITLTGDDPVKAQIVNAYNVLAAVC